MSLTCVLAEDAHVDIGYLRILHITADLLHQHRMRPDALATTCVHFLVFLLLGGGRLPRAPPNVLRTTIHFPCQYLRICGQLVSPICAHIIRQSGLNEGWFCNVCRVKLDSGPCYSHFHYNRTTACQTGLEGKCERGIRLLPIIYNYKHIFYLKSSFLKFKYYIIN